MPTTTPNFHEYVYGDETTRLRFERANPDEAGLYEHERVYDEWTADEASHLAAIARQLFQHGEWTHTGDLERDSCGACALNGYISDSARLDGWTLEDGPNYAGWARVYVQNGRAIPEHWRAAFADSGYDNSAYFNALGRDLVTFGHPGFVA